MMSKAERLAWVHAAAARATVLVDGEPATLVFASPRRCKVRRFARHEWVAIQRVALLPPDHIPAAQGVNIPNRG